MNLHNYQLRAVEHIKANPYCGLFLEMGLGKTVSCLMALSELIYSDLEVEKVLIIAPLRVAKVTWPAEIRKWGFNHISYALVLGSATERVQALNKKTDLYIINRENVPWLVTHYQTAFPFDMVVIDELSSFKSHDASRFRALRTVRPRISRLVGLTGTPAANGLIDLWAPLFLMDRGERLGKTVGEFRKRYFVPGQTNGHIVYNYRLQKGAAEQIKEKIGDICISMQSKDYLELPGHVVIDHEVEIDQKEYNKFERDQVLKVKDTEISALSAAALTNKLLQYANGALYDEDRSVHEVHKAKLDELQAIIDEAMGQPVLIFYNFIHDLNRGLAKIGGKKLDGEADVNNWNAGNLPILWAHPASAGHGLNLQGGGNIIVWFGMPWSLELYDQAIARLDRQGQDKTVIVHRLIAKGTMDEDVAAALQGKASGQLALMEALKARIEKWTTDMSGQ